VSFKEIRDKAGNSIGYEYSTEFPGDGDDCRTSVVISHGVQIDPQHRGKGAGSWAHGERLARFKNEGHKYALCTVRKDNHVQRAILAKFNWKELDEFTNAEGSEILLMGRGL
jgi:GNAT superfamily N-acetyltransferase